jgi:hypothetical protein
VPAKQASLLEKLLQYLARSREVARKQAEREEKLLQYLANSSDIEKKQSLFDE